MRTLNTVLLEPVLKSGLYFLSLQHRHLYNAHTRYCPFGVRIKELTVFLISIAQTSLWVDQEDSKIPTRFLLNDCVTLHNYCDNIYNAYVWTPYLTELTSGSNNWDCYIPFHPKPDKILPNFNQSDSPKKVKPSWFSLAPTQSYTGAPLLALADIMC